MLFEFLELQQAKFVRFFSHTLQQALYQNIHSV